jgi:uroporphyrin-3 C-methyltransferase
MLNAIGTLPMTALPAPSSSPELKVDESQKSPWLKKIFDQIKLLGDRLVRVQVVGDVRDISLTPAAQDLIRQQLKLHLLSARMAWLSNLPQTCRDDLNQAQTLLAKHFQPQASSVISFEKALIDLKAEVEKSSALMKGQ